MKHHPYLLVYTLLALIFLVVNPSNDHFPYHFFHPDGKYCLIERGEEHTVRLDAVKCKGSIIIHTKYPFLTIWIDNNEDSDHIHVVKTNWSKMLHAPLITPLNTILSDETMLTFTLHNISFPDLSKSSVFEFTLKRNGILLLQAVADSSPTVIHPSNELRR